MTSGTYLALPPSAAAGGDPTERGQRNDRSMRTHDLF